MIADGLILVALGSVAVSSSYSTTYMNMSHTSSWQQTIFAELWTQPTKNCCDCWQNTIYNSFILSLHFWHVCF